MALHGNPIGVAREALCHGGKGYWFWSASAPWRFLLISSGLQSRRLVQRFLLVEQKTHVLVTQRPAHQRTSVWFTHAPQNVRRADHTEMSIREVTIMEVLFR